MNCFLPYEVEVLLSVAPILPLYGIDENGICTCGNSSCKSAGKHPISRNGSMDATQEKSVLLHYVSQHSTLNWGMTLPNLMVLDIDPRNGGDKELEKLQNEIPEITKTLTQKTGGGGLHLFFRKPDFSSKGKLGRGIDIKSGATSYVVIAPSRHVSGGCYQWAT